MRLLVILLTILLLLNILGFLLTNLETRVGVTVWKTQHQNVPLFGIVIISVVAGILYAGVIAVAEGANLRIENRRLRREIQKLETELVYVRTQPRDAPPPEPDAIQETPPGSRSEPRVEESGGEVPASAPVYDPDDYGWESGPPDDTYSGGRAV